MATFTVFAAIQTLSLVTSTPAPRMPHTQAGHFYSWNYDPRPTVAVDSNQVTAGPVARNNDDRPRRSGYADFTSLVHAAYIDAREGPGPGTSKYAIFVEVRDQESDGVIALHVGTVFSVSTMREVYEALNYTFPDTPWKVSFSFE